MYRISKVDHSSVSCSIHPSAYFMGCYPLFPRGKQGANIKVQHKNIWGITITKEQPPMFLPSHHSMTTDAASTQAEAGEEKAPDVSQSSANISSDSPTLTVNFHNQLRLNWFLGLRIPNSKKLCLLRLKNWLCLTESTVTAGLPNFLEIMILGEAQNRGSATTESTRQSIRSHIRGPGWSSGSRG